jgi:hypothetical protein
MHLNFFSYLRCEQNNSLACLKVLLHSGPPVQISLQSDPVLVQDDIVRQKLIPGGKILIGQSAIKCLAGVQQLLVLLTLQCLRTLTRCSSRALKPSGALDIAT